METRSKLDEIYEREQANKERERKQTDDLKLACKEIFSDMNGKFFLQYLKQICLWSEQDLNINNEILIYKKGRRDIWTIIRNVIPKDVLAQIEIYGTEENQN